MKLLHLADLHLGKSLYFQSLIEGGDQPYWVEQLLALLERERPDAVLIAGDVYDRGVPSRDAVQLLSSMLTRIARLHIPVLMIAGNHDGGERMEFLSTLLADSCVHIAGTVRRDMVHVSLEDREGPVHFWLMPYVYPAAVREALGVGEDVVNSYTTAVQALLDAQPIDWTQRNVLIAHQTVMAAGQEVQHSESDTAVGGVGAVDAALLERFDYVALGHIHGAYPVGQAKIRYAGAPLCYHFKEAKQVKGPLLVELGAKGEPLGIRTETLAPLHRVRPIMTGSLAEIIAQETASEARGEYVCVQLNDELVPPETHDQLEKLFASHDCTLLELGRIPRAAVQQESEAMAQRDDLTLEEHFLQFYRKQTGTADPTGDDAALISLLAGQIDSHADKTEEELVAELVAAALAQEAKEP